MSEVNPAFADTPIGRISLVDAQGNHIGFFDTENVEKVTEHLTAEIVRTALLNGVVPTTSDRRFIDWVLYRRGPGDYVYASRQRGEMGSCVFVGRAIRASETATVCLQKGFEVPAIVSADCELPATPNEGNSEQATHSIDFRSVNWYGTPYTFSANQAACVKIWWEHWRQQTPDVSDAAVLEAAEVNSRLRALFQGHDAWGTMIVEGATKGTHRLAGPPRKP